MHNWKHAPELAGQLTAYDFPVDPVVLRFEDESTVRFRYAFIQVEGEFTVVYTEHCGYHVFYTEGIVEAEGRVGPLPPR
jgi:hypothetical protein